jgi:hypothetical protein
MSDAILVSIIGGGFSVAVALLELSRRQNNRDHGRNADKLDDVLINLQRVEKKTDRYGDRLQNHIDYHATQAPPKPTRKPAQKRKPKP